MSRYHISKAPADEVPSAGQAVAAIGLMFGMGLLIVILNAIHQLKG